MRVTPLPKDLWSLILVKYLDIHSLHHMYDTSQSMRQYYKKNQIWRKRVPIDRLDYWDQCELTDPYRLLLAISVIGKIELIIPWRNDIRAEMILDEEVDSFGIHKVTDDVTIFKNLNNQKRFVKSSSNVVSITYRLLDMRCTKIEYYSCPPLQNIMCSKLAMPQLFPIK
jgi:hypothetical protein